MTAITDLALEAAEYVGGGSVHNYLRRAMTSSDSDGVRISSEHKDFADVTSICIESDKAQKALGKRRGTYVTVEVKGGEINTYRQQMLLSEELSAQLKFFVENFNLEKGPVLVIGLGNRYVTPDSLGTCVAEKILATHHIKKRDDKAARELFRGMGDVCTFSAGVMGITGIESAEVIKGLAKLTGACGVIVVDALAARRTSRVNRVFQLTDTGIVPGSGVGNRRFEISRDTLGIPVVAIGVPTVVDAIPLTCDVMIKAQGIKCEPEDIRSELSTEMFDNMIVTPKNVDAAIERLSRVIADAVNMTLHRGVNINEINEFFI